MRCMSVRSIGMVNLRMKTYCSSWADFSRLTEMSPAYYAKFIGVPEVLVRDTHAVIEALDLKQVGAPVRVPKDPYHKFTFHMPRNVAGTVEEIPRYLGMLSEAADDSYDLEELLRRAVCVLGKNHELGKHVNMDDVLFHRHPHRAGVMNVNFCSRSPDVLLAQIDLREGTYTVFDADPEDHPEIRQAVESLFKMFDLKLVSHADKQTV